MKKKQLDDIKRTHDNILEAIQSFLTVNGVELDINKQVDNFYNDPTYKLYKGIRSDKGYNKWKEDVIKRFENQCCVCFSRDKLVSHHLFSYKYYSNLRTEINNGVCICETCHELFNQLYSNINTCEQFTNYRKKFLGKSHDFVKKQTKPKRILITEALINKSKNEPEQSKDVSLVAENFNIEIIVSSFEELKKKLLDEAKTLEKKYGREKGIRINFRGKETTSLSAITKLWAEIMRINTLISANRMKDKTIMASKFHMNHEEFCKKLQDPNEYLNFTPSEITHLNKILYEDYKQEHLEERSKEYAKVNLK